MPYASELEQRIARKTTRAITEYAMIEDGDRVMVGLSGGKDSWALMQILDVLRRRAPIDFTVVAVNVDSGYKEYQHDVIRQTCQARGWELRIEHTTIGETMDDILSDGATPCSLCARLRRGVLYRLAEEVGATKIALGHHADDFIETLLLNLFFTGSLKAMPARLVSDDGRHVVVRPLVYVSESEARQYTKANALPIVGCCCPACGDLSLQRQRVKRLLHELELEHPEVKNSMLKALANVHPRHLLDHNIARSRDRAIERCEGSEPVQVVLQSRSRDVRSPDNRSRNIRPPDNRSRDARSPDNRSRDARSPDNRSRDRSIARSLDQQ
jgi:tRNA 2-thiocytidine biosynthesis protein TtcA